MRISDWSSDVCSSDLQTPNDRSGVLAAAVDDAAKAASTAILFHFTRPDTLSLMIWRPPSLPGFARLPLLTLMHAARTCLRSEEHTSELQSLMRISYAVFCLKKKKTHTNTQRVTNQREQ